MVDERMTGKTGDETGRKERHDEESEGYKQ
jgi:hypothetical protein